MNYQISIIFVANDLQESQVENIWLELWDAGGLRDEPFKQMYTSTGGSVDFEFDTNDVDDFYDQSGVDEFYIRVIQKEEFTISSDDPSKGMYEQGFNLLNTESDDWIHSDLSGYGFFDGGKLVLSWMQSTPQDPNTTEAKIVITAASKYLFVKAHGEYNSNQARIANCHVFEDDTNNLMLKVDQKANQYGDYAIKIPVLGSTGPTEVIRFELQFGGHITIPDVLTFASDTFCPEIIQKQIESKSYGGRITVLDSAGQPIPNVAVELEDWESQGRGPFRSEITDAQGNVSIMFNKHEILDFYGRYINRFIFRVVDYENGDRTNLYESFKEINDPNSSDLPDWGDAEMRGVWFLNEVPILDEVLTITSQAQYVTVTVRNANSQSPMRDAILERYRPQYRSNDGTKEESIRLDALGRASFRVWTSDSITRSDTSYFRLVQEGHDPVDMRRVDVTKWNPTAFGANEDGYWVPKELAPSKSQTLEFEIDRSRRIEITGVVRDQLTGAGVPDVNVCLVGAKVDDFGSTSADDITAIASTDSSGAFNMSIAEYGYLANRSVRGTSRVRLVDSDGVSINIFETTSGAEVQYHDFTIDGNSSYLELEIDGANLSAVERVTYDLVGTLRDIEGAPLIGYKVASHDVNAAVQRGYATTNRNGQFVLRWTESTNGQMSINRDFNFDTWPNRENDIYTSNDPDYQNVSLTLDLQVDEFDLTVERKAKEKFKIISDSEFTLKARQTHFEVLSGSNDPIGDVQEYVDAKVQEKYVALQAFELQGAVGTKWEPSMPLPPQLENHCTCHQCTSSFSKFAYLSDLIHYAENRASLGASGGSVTEWDKLLGQSLETMPVQCSVTRDKVSIGRVAIESLRRKIREEFTKSQNTDFSQAAVYQDTKGFAGVAYYSILDELNVSPMDLLTASVRLTAGEEPSPKALQIANRLGVLVEDLPLLAFDVEQRSSLNELTLEALFGFRATIEDDLSDVVDFPSPWRELSEPLLVQLQRQALAKTWYVSDHSENSSEDLQVIIDPDLVAISEAFNNPIADTILLSRRNWIREREEAYLNAVNPLVGGEIHNILIVSQGLGLEGSSIDSQNNQIATAWDLILGPSITALEANEELPEEFKSTFLTRTALKDLGQIKHDVDNEIVVAKSRWHVAISHMLAAEKRAQFLGWKQEEADANIALSPEFFQLKATDSAALFGNIPVIASQRWDLARRLRWVEVLESRTAKWNQLEESLAEVIEKTEERVLPLLRKQLIKIYGKSFEESDKQLAPRVSNEILLDVEASASQRETRIDLAINAVQTLLYRGRVGSTDLPENTEVYVDRYDFDEVWEWLGDYTSWQSALAVLTYPENFLGSIPRRSESHLFRNLSESLYQSNKLNHAQACEIAKSYSEETRRATGDLDVIASCHTRARIADVAKCSTQTFQKQNAVVMVAKSPVSSIGTAQAYYWSIYFPETKTHELWSTIDFKSDSIDQVLGLGHSEGRVYVIYRYDDSKFAAKPYNVDERVWETTMELGEGPGMSSRRVTYGCSSSTRNTRHLAITLFNYSEGEIWVADVDLLKGLMVSNSTSLNEDSEGSDSVWRRVYIPDIYEDAGYGEVKSFVIPSGLVLFVNVGGYIIYRHIHANQNLENEKGYPWASHWKMLGEGRLKAILVYEYKYGSALNFSMYRAHVGYVETDPVGQRVWSECRVDDLSIPLHSNPRIQILPQNSSLGNLWGFEASSFAQYTNAVGEVGESWLVVNGHSDTLGQGSAVAKFELENDSSSFPTLEEFRNVTVLLDDYFGPVTSDLDILANISRRSSLEAVLDNIQSFATSAVYEAIEEYFFFAPLLISHRLRESGHYRHALDWLATVYDYSLEVERRRIYPILRDDLTYTRSVGREDWIRDPLDPHAIAGMRPKAYLKYVVFECVQSLIEWAKNEFRMESRESRARAHSLFKTAQQVLEEEELLPLTYSECSLTDFESYLRQKLGGESRPIDENFVSETLLVLSSIERVSERQSAIAQIQSAVDAFTGPSTDLVIRTVCEQIELIQSQPVSPMDFAALISESEDAMEDLRGEVGTQDSSRESLSKISSSMKSRLLLSVASYTGESVEDVANGSDKAEAIVGAGEDQEQHVSSSDDKLLKLTEVPTFTVRNGLQRIFGTTVRFTKSFSPWPHLVLCAPPNPVFDMLRAEVNANLVKLRLGLSLGGNHWTPRDEKSVATTSAMAALSDVSDLRAILSGGAQNSGVLTERNQYRYGVLVEIARRFAQGASQAEAAYFSAIRDLDNEDYRVLVASQSLQISSLNRQTRRLQSELARQQLTIPELQATRSFIQKEHYKDLIEKGNSGLENAALVLQGVAAAGYASAAVASFTDVINWSNIWSNAASAASTTAGMLQTMASYERREEEWILQRDLAENDYQVGTVQIDVAKTQVRLATVEEQIGDLQAEHARDTLTYLQTKFTSAQFFRWLVTEYSKIYERSLSAATEMAHLAYRQLVFERQASITNPIADNYMDVPSADSLVDGNARGITGSARLLRDLVALEQEAVQSNVRRLHMSKIFSVRRLAPDALYQLISTGEMLFETPESLYDRDYPGHYHRIIEQVRVSIVALTPATEGIRASLSSDGRSRTTIEPTSSTQTSIHREEQRIAFSSPVDANGVFELNPQSELLRPFEGLGVETTFRLELPKAANPWDFRSIQDVLITVDYSAKHDHGKYTRTVEELGTEVSEQRAFSLRNEFVDAWYQFVNSDDEGAGREIEFELRASRFRPSLKSESVVSKIVRLYVVAPELDASDIPAIDVELSFDASEFAYGLAQEGIASSNRGSTWAGAGFEGDTPFGVWRLRFPGIEEGEDFEPNAIEALISSGELYDLVFVVEYDAELPAWPGTLSGGGL